MIFERNSKVSEQPDSTLLIRLLLKLSSLCVVDDESKDQLGRHQGNDNEAPTLQQRLLMLYCTLYIIPFHLIIRSLTHSTTSQATSQANTK